MKAKDLTIGGEYLYNLSDRKYEHDDRRVRVIEVPVAGSRYSGRLDSARVEFLNIETGEVQMTKGWGNSEPVEDVRVVPLRSLIRSWADHIPVMEKRAEERAKLNAENDRIDALARKLNDALGLEPKEKSRWRTVGIFTAINRTDGPSFELSLDEEGVTSLLAKLRDSQ